MGAKVSFTDYPKPQAGFDASDQGIRPLHPDSVLQHSPVFLSGLGDKVVKDTPLMERDMFMLKGLFKEHRTGINMLKQQRMVFMPHHPDLILFEGPEIKPPGIDGVIYDDHVGDIFPQKSHTLSGEYLLHRYPDFRIVLFELGNDKRQDTVQSPGYGGKPQLTRLPFGKAFQIGSYLGIGVQQLPAVLRKGLTGRRQIRPSGRSGNQHDIKFTLKIAYAPRCRGGGDMFIPGGRADTAQAGNGQKYAQGDYVETFHELTFVV